LVPGDIAEALDLTPQAVYYRAPSKIERGK